jgi:hypothetical protein
MTPEARIKAKIRKFLSTYDGMYTYWPVPSGYGKTTLDVLGCYRGFFFCIEAKAPGKKPTLRQAEELKNIGLAMGRTFVVDDVADLDEVRDWLDQLKETTDDHPHLTPDSVRRHSI